MLLSVTNLAFIESPIQIMVVLLIALIVFGPKRLPELGKQLGNGLRELNKAKNDLMRSINLDHEPDPEPYNYNYPAISDSSYASAYTPPPDLTDYTIAGHPVHDVSPDGTVARSNGTEYNNSYADYSVAAPHNETGHETAGAAAETHNETHSESQPAVSRDPSLAQTQTQTHIAANPEGDHRA